MAAGSTSARLAGARDRIVAEGWAAHRRWPLLEFPIELVRRWVRVNASVLAGHLAFRLFVFMVPLLFVLVAMLGYASNSGVDVADETENLRMGQALARSIAQTGQQTEDSSVQLGIIGLIALISAASGLVAAFRLVVATVWEVPVKAASRSKLKTMAWLLPGVAMITAGIALKQFMTRRGLLFDGLGVATAVAINSAVVLGLFWILPRRAERLVDLLPGAVAAAVGFAGLNIATALYFTDKLQKSSQVYGTLGVVVTVLAYLFFVGQVIVLSSIVNTIWYDRDAILERVRNAGETAPGDARTPPRSEPDES